MKMQKRKKFLLPSPTRARRGGHSRGTRARPCSAGGETTSAKLLWTLAEAARVWGMSERTLRRRIQSGLIETINNANGAPCIEAATVHALLAARWCSRQGEQTREVAS